MVKLSGKTEVKFEETVVLGQDGDLLWSNRTRYSLHED